MVCSMQQTPPSKHHPLHQSDAKRHATHTTPFSVPSNHCQTIEGRDAGKQGRTGDGIPPRVVDGVEEGSGGRTGRWSGTRKWGTRYTNKEATWYPFHHPRTSTPNMMPPARPHVCWSDITSKRGAPTCARLSCALFLRCSSTIITAACTTAKDHSHARYGTPTRLAVAREQAFVPGHSDASGCRSGR